MYAHSPSFSVFLLLPHLLFHSPPSPPLPLPPSFSSSSSFSFGCSVSSMCCVFLQQVVMTTCAIDFDFVLSFVFLTESHDDEWASHTSSDGSVTKLRAHYVCKNGTNWTEFLKCFTLTCSKVWNRRWGDVHCDAEEVCTKYKQRW